MSSFKKKRRKFMRPIEAFPVFVFLYFIKIFTLKGARRVGSILGFFLYCIPSQRKLALANLDVAFPNKTVAEKKKIACKAIQGIVTVFVEFMWFYKRPEKYQKFIHVPDEFKKIYHEKKSPDKGAIFLSMHWGNWEMVSRGLKLTDKVDGSVIARKLKNPYLEKLMTEGRSGKGLSVIHEKGATRGIVKSLKQNLSIGMLVDQNTKTHQGGVFGKFFGLPVTITKAPASLARKMNTTLMCVNCKRTADGFEMCAKELPKEVADYESDSELSEDILSLMEEFVREVPEQWVWLYHRWNYIPTNWLDAKDKYPYYAVVDKKLDYPKEPSLKD